MRGIKNKVEFFGKKVRNNRISILFIILVVIAVISIIIAYRAKKSYRQVVENNYNMAFFQLVDNVQDVEIFLAKALISNSPESGAETLTYVWREANMAQTYLSMLPISSSELENTAKFLNQVSDYSYSLSRKTIDNQSLEQSDLDNLTKLHNYSLELKNTLNQLSVDLNDGRISWQELTKTINPAFTKQASNISKDSFNSVEENFHEYAGLIYDGAFSEHMTNPERRGLTGDEIDEKSAEEIAKKFFGEDRVKSISSEGSTQSANIEAYNFVISSTDNDTVWISISKKGGHIISMNSNRVVNAEVISQENVDKIAEDFLIQKNFPNMKKTYFSKNGGIETINFAYQQNGVTVYPDLIKLKVALDNGEVLGIETTGYLNSHVERNIPEPKITKEDAVLKINSNIDILSVGIAIIPTEFQTEHTCYEIRGRIEQRDFLAYVNVETGKVEDILIVLNSTEGTLTM